MRRFLGNKAALASALSLAAVFLAAPHAAHAGFWDIITSTGSFIEKVILAPFEILILPLAATVMWISGTLMDAAINFSLHTAYIMDMSPAINLGWVVVRDLCNLLFIFALIWMSLRLITGLDTGWKAALTKLVIAAVLLNFSLFFTKAMIDVSNVFGNWLYGGIQSTLQANSSTENRVSLSGLIATRMDIIGLWDATKNASSPQTVGQYLGDPSKGFIGIFLRLAIVLATTYIFIYSAVLFIARAITLLFLAVFSPVMVLGKAFDQVSDYSKMWWGELQKALTFPVVFLLMLYISLQFINSLGALELRELKDAAAPMGISVSRYFQYFIILFLLQATLSAAKSSSGVVGKALGGVASGLSKLAVNAVGTYATGGVIAGMRAIGRGAGAAATMEWKSAKDFSVGKTWNTFKKTAGENLPPTLTNVFGKTSQLSLDKARKSVNEFVSDKAKNGTWDVRNIPTGAGSVGDALAGAVSFGTDGAKIDMKAPSQKDVKAQKSAWDEERKKEKAETNLLRDIVALETARLDLDEAKSSTGPSRNADIAAAQEVIWKTEDSISKTLGDLSNKQLEKLSKKALNDPRVLDMLTANQLDYLAEKSELSEGDKTKIREARHRGINSSLFEVDKDGKILRNPDGTPKENPKLDKKKVAEATKKLGKKELESLPVDVLSNPHFAESLDSDKLDTILRSDSIGAGSKGRIKANRYRKMAEIVANPSTKADDIRNEFDRLKMKANEISKLDKEMFIDRGGAVNETMMEAIKPEVLDKMIVNEVDDGTRAKIRKFVEANPTINQPLADWLQGNRGRVF